jgi:CheY-like chemotaxis protein
LQISEDIPAILVGDEMRIKQVLNNLISIARKFAILGGVMLSASFESVPGSDNGMLVLIVKNTTAGMTEEQVKLIYEEYARFDTEVEYPEDGAGLGLSITERLVELMNGSVNATATFSKGAELTVRLPQKVLNRKPIARKAIDSLKACSYARDNRRERRKLTRDVMPYGKVLIVDDAESNILVTVALLNVYELQIETVESGFAAIKKINAGNSYDVIFMDHVMPILDGVETTKHIRDSGYSLPIIALTANAMSENEEYFLANGFDAVVMKPVDIRLLTTVLNKYVRDKQPPDVLEETRKL